MRVLLPLLAALCLPAGAATVAIQNVNVIDVTTGSARPHLTVVVTGERIVAIGPAASARIPAGARLVNGKDKFLIPGLWDMHVQLWYPQNQLPVFVAFGVTGVQDMGSNYRQVTTWRNNIEAGQAIGPHVLTSGPAVTGGGPYDNKMPVIFAHSPDEARSAFDTLWDMSTDFIQILPDLSHDAYIALAEQARHWDLRLVGPIPTSISAAEMLEARQRSVEYLSGVSRNVSTEAEALDFFERCATEGVRISPGLVLWRRLGHLDPAAATDPRLKYVPEAIRATWPTLTAEDAEATKDQVDGIYRLTSLITRTKVQALAGTYTGDPYTIPGATLHDELEQMVAAGMEPRQALEAATLAPAKFIGWEDALGTVAKGKVADLVLLDANPITDIKNIRKIAAVFTRGKYYSRKDLDAILAAVK